MKKLILILTIGILSAFSVQATETVNKKFIGSWKVNYEKTLIEARKSPKYKAKDKERMKKSIQKMLKRMTIGITENELVFDMGKRKKALKSVKIEKKNDNDIMFFEMGKKKFKFQVTLTLIDGQYLNFKSTASDDMNFYIWEKGTGDKTIKDSEIVIEATKEAIKK